MRTRVKADESGKAAGAAVRHAALSSELAQTYRVASPQAGGRSKPSAKTEASRRAIRVFQIFYEKWHRQVLDKSFDPYDNRGIKSELLEFAVFEKIAKSRKVSGAQLWGALSWRFAEKTGMTGAALREAIAAKPGYDVYFCNPFPDNEALYHNVWTQGEIPHPRFLELVRAFFKAASLPAEHIDALQPSGTFAAANYFIATPAFWEAYLKFIRRALGNADRKLAPAMRKLLHSKMADAQGFHFGATYVPFIVERLFSVFLATDGAMFKACKLVLPEREKELNAHMKLLRDMRDVAQRTRSTWLAACWVNYRNLYFSHVHGRDWCKEHLRHITPLQIEFA
jgi:hypothetical protein